MKQKFYPLLSITVLFTLFFQLPLFGQPFSLLKDINPGSNGSSYFNFTDVNGVLFFRPDDGIHGDELWKTDGTTAGTIMVKDINPTGSGSELDLFTNINGVLYFIANDGLHGVELWKSDGSAVGTIMIKDISIGENGSNPTSFSSINGTLYFNATDGINGRELWKSNGTADGTVMVKDIFPGSSSIFGSIVPNSSNPQSFTAANNIIYFSASDAQDRSQVWRTDGTITGTTMVKDIYPELSSALINFISLQGNLYFTVYGGTNGNELWKSDGTNVGTVKIKTLFGGNFENHCTTLNGALYFLESDGLWKSDGTELGTVLLKSRDDSFPYSPELLMSVNGLLYFTGYDAMHGWELWKSDGTPGGTTLVKDINAGVDNSGINSFATIGNKLMFSADNAIQGGELWVSDGSAAGTKLVQDIEPGSGSAIPALFYEVKGTIIEVNGKVFASINTSNLGTEVWVGNIPADIGLPLDLLTFKGTLVNNDGLLEWKTENESNTASFIVERSIDGQNFQQVGVVVAANTTGLHSYNLTDPNITSLETVIVYYRLKQVDMGEKYTYSEIVTLAIDKKKGSVTLYPNPVLTEMNLRVYTPQKEKLQWQLIDNNGRLIQHGQYELSPGITVVSENIGRLSPGVYFMKISGLALQKMIKVIKK